MSTGVDPERCPLCGGGNDCGLARGAEHCWCFEATIASDVIERIPAEARGVVCVCRSCATSDAPPGGASPRGGDQRHKS